MYKEHSDWSRCPDYFGCSHLKERSKALPLEGIDEDTHFHDASLGLT